MSNTKRFHDALRTCQQHKREKEKRKKEAEESGECIFNGFCISGERIFISKK